MKIKITADEGLNITTHIHNTENMKYLSITQGLVDSVQQTNYLFFNNASDCCTKNVPITFPSHQVLEITIEFIA